MVPKLCHATPAAERGGQQPRDHSITDRFKRRRRARPAAQKASRRRCQRRFALAVLRRTTMKASPFQLLALLLLLLADPSATAPSAGSHFSFFFAFFFVQLGISIWIRKKFVDVDHPAAVADVDAADDGFAADDADDDDDDDDDADADADDADADDAANTRRPGSSQREGGVTRLVFFKNII